MQELLVSSLATADVLTKFLIEKGLITQAEFMQMREFPAFIKGPRTRRRGKTAEMLLTNWSLSLG